MGKIVVGVDASTEAREALEWARAHAHDDDEILAVHAWDVPLVAGYEVAVAIDPAEIREAAAGFLDGIVTAADDPRVVGLLAQGHPGRSLVDASENAEMIVLGHRGSGKASVILGSTANYVLHHVERPVVVIRGDRFGPAHRVVVGVDDHGLDGAGHENPSVRALRWAYGLVGVQEIAVLHAWFAPGVAAGVYAGAGADMEEMDRAATAVVNHVMEMAGPIPSDVTVRQVVERGTPGFALIEASRTSDLVVVGSRGRGGFVGLLLGSSSLEAAAHSHAPVAIIR
jgi:nucleotide-binding universal stress UspA family protein